MNENNLVTKLDGCFVSGKLLVDAVRFLKQMMPMSNEGIYIMSPVDKFVIHVLATAWYQGSGTATTFPNDVTEWIYSIRHKLKEMDTNGPS